MKTNFLKKGILVIFCLLPFYLSAQKLAVKSKYIIKGNIEGLPDDTRFFLIKYSKEMNADTTAIVTSKGGKFTFNSELVEEGESNWIKLDTTSIHITLKGVIATDAILIDSRKIDISGTMKDWPKVKIQGSKATNIYQKLADTILRCIEPLRKFKSYSRESAPIRTQVSEEIVSILCKYGNEYATPIIAANMTTMLNSKQIKQIYDSLTNRIKSTLKARILKTLIEQVYASENIKQGNIIPSFNVTGPNGEVINILTYAAKNKFTLIDFWASWCTPCRAEIPNLKKLHTSLKENGFGILGISSDDSVQAWLKALKEENMAWNQARGKVGKEFFGISSIPSYVLIDQQGKLIAFDCGAGLVKTFGPGLRGEELANTLNQLFQKEDKGK